jgi:hypothetical protein
VNLAMKRPRPIETVAEIARGARGLVSRHPAGALLALGTALRLTLFLRNGGYWLDEASLSQAIRDTRLSNLFGPVSSSQLAPVGFLAVERVAYRLLGDSSLSLRLLPLLGGLASLWLFQGVAERSLSPRAALLALAMFVVSEDLIGFTAELKPYSTDVAFALLCTLFAMMWQPLWTPTIQLALVGTVAVWFSFPATFVLAGLGAVLAVSSAARRDTRALTMLGSVALIWSANVAGVQWAAKRQLVSPHAMDVFWGFSFPGHPISPGGLAEWTAKTLTYLFANPMDLYIPGVGWTIPALVGLGFFMVGCASMARRDPRNFGLLAAPLGLTLLAASMRLYPCHGRLVLFLVPALILLVAEGADHAAEALRSRVGWRLAVVWLAVLPASLALGQWIEPKGTPSHNHHGDRRPYWLEPAKFPF